MADMIRSGAGGGSDRDRGQLLLVTGFAIAVAIVALVILLNTAIYTQNLATRDVDTGADDALAYRDTVEDGLWPVVRAENAREYDNRPNLTSNVRDRVDQFVMLSAQHHLESGASANGTDRTLHQGTWLRQNGSRHMTNSSGNHTWTMATDANDVRGFEMNTTGGIAAVSDVEDEAFNVTVRGSNGDRWRFYVYEDPDPELAVNDTGSFERNICSGLFSDPPRVNLTAGTVNGADCSDLVFANNTDPPYDIIVSHGDRTEGTYNVTVNGTTAVGDAPEQFPVVYSLSVDVVYQTETLEYRDRVLIAPEEDE
jgi:hypothetical protein